MMTNRRPPFPGTQSCLTAETGEAAIGVTRFSPVIPNGGEYLPKMAGEDAFVILFQMRDMPAHEFSLDGKLERVRDVSRGTLNIVDLGIGEAWCRLRHPVDTLMFHVPLGALVEIADGARAPRVDRLRAPDPWFTRDAVVDRLAPMLIEALQHPERATKLFYDHLLLALGAHFAERYGGLRPQTGRLRGGLAPWQERHAKDMLSANLSSDISLKVIAQQCSLSPDYFSRAFKASTGVTPHAWRQMQRVSRAKILLDTTLLPLAKIADVCGFSDQSHFTRVFSRHVGESPGSWRLLRR
jgi:AraC family transcriptional regulator